MSQRSTTARLLRHTPMRDLIRFRVTGRLDIDTLLERSGLPAPAAACVLRVVHRTRLWRLEKVSVAQELIAHFADGMASGATCDDLLARFGGEKQTALLIRRAKKRKRPFMWKAAKALVLGVIFLFLFYAGMAVYFFAGKPTVRVNYVEMLNRVAALTPEDQAAWPLYRTALLDLKLDSPEAGAFYTRANNLAGAAEWDVWSEFAALHFRELALVRRAAAMPHLGLLSGVNIPAEDRQALGMTAERAELAALNPTLQGIPLPHLGRLRMVARLLTADGRTATTQGDGLRAFADVKAIFGISRHIEEQPLRINSFVALNARRLALTLLSDIITWRPELLTNEQLQELNGEVLPEARDTVLNFSGERWVFEDIIQRAYTDDGRGDGRLTLEGIPVIEFSIPRRIVGFAEKALSPASILSVASRREVLAKYDDLIQRNEALARKPFRDTLTDSISQEVRKWSSFERLRYYPITKRGVDDFDSVRINQEIERGIIDGAMIGIALERYRRDHGNLPDKLESLVPGYLVTLPVDRITGEALHYSIQNGQAVVYSVGANRKDDGGHPFTTPDGAPHPAAVARWYDDPIHAPTGDWILWPIPEE